MVYGTNSQGYERSRVRIVYIGYEQSRVRIVQGTNSLETNDIMAVVYRLQSCCCVLCLDTMMLQVSVLHHHHHHCHHQVTCWEAGVWIPAPINFCLSFLSSVALLSAAYFPFIRSLSRCILFLHLAAFALIPPSIISYSNDSFLSTCPNRMFAFSHCV